MNFNKRSILILLFTLIFNSLKAQQPSEQLIDEKTQQKIEKLAESEGEEVDLNTMFDQLKYFGTHPLNLNHASREDLQSLLLLNDLQIDALLRHIQENGKLIALEELQTIDEFDMETISSILPYVTIAENNFFEKLSLKKMLTEGKSTVFIRGQKIIEEQAGYVNKDSASFANNKSYAGNQLKLYTRYRYTFSNRISIGVTGEKDAGEEFFKGTQPNGFDFYSAHLYYRGTGIVRSFVLGDYQAQYGQGVVMWSGLAFGKSSDVMNLKRNARGLLPYTSIDENNFMRGGAAAFGIKKFQLDLFYSSHKIDANVLPSDSVTQNGISSFETSGYHRTIAELNDRHSINEVIKGGHLQYKSSRIKLGATAYSTDFSQPLEKKTSLYNEFEYAGNHNLNYGVDYSYLINNFHFFGEAARSESSGIAYMNGALIGLDPRLSLSIMQRHYDKNYQSLKSNAISENSKNENENGLLLGLLVKPARNFTFNAYFDQFSFPWLRYLVDAPSKGHEYEAQLNYTPSKTFDAYIRLRQQNKPVNISGGDFLINRLQDVAQTNYRFNIRYKVSPSFILGNRIEYLTLDRSASPAERGYMIYQDVSYHPMKSRYTFSLRYVLFDTDSYDSRIYSYESDVLYYYYVPFYDYRGSIYYLIVHYKIVKGIDIWLRIGRTEYDNRQTVSSGLDQINAPHKTEVKAQVRFEF